MDKYKLSHETAEQQFNVLADYYEIDGEGATQAQKERADVIKAKIIKAIRLGRVEISNEGGIKVKQHLRNPAGEVATIDYAEISGKAKIATGGKTENDHYGRIYALLGSVSGLGETAILSLKGVDLSLAECLGAYFLEV